MRFSSLFRALLPAAALGVLCVGSSMVPDQSGAQTKNHACPSNESGLKLPAGFCATDIRRQDWSRPPTGGSAQRSGLCEYVVGRLLPSRRQAARRRVSGSSARQNRYGKADVIERFRRNHAERRAGGHGHRGRGRRHGHRPL